MLILILSPTKGFFCNCMKSFEECKIIFWKVFENYLIYVLLWIVTTSVVQITDSLNIARLQGTTCVCMFYCSASKLCVELLFMLGSVAMF